jgi:dUTP pyrophosphatase
MPDAPSIVFEALHADVAIPERATAGSAGYDVRAYLRGRVVRIWRDGTTLDHAVGEEGTLDLAPGEIALVPLGFRARVPDGYEAQLRLRSSVAFKRGLVMPNAPGTIDSDYPDEWLVMLRNVSATTTRIEHGERIAQVVLARYEVLEWAAGEVRATTRAGGVGSTGR